MELVGEDFSVIEVRVRSVAQLFNSLDPSPFHERDLDEDAEEYIVGWARELPAGKAIVIRVHVTGDIGERLGLDSFGTALTNYFSYRAKVLERDFRDHFRLGWRYLSVGVPLLVFCLIASQMVHSYLGTGPFARVIGESLIIVGWVANWKPIETFLYDWWPLRRRWTLYRNLSEARVEVVAG